MDRITELSLWIEVGVIVIVGGLLLLLLMRALRYVAGWANITDLALRPLKFVVRWVGILLIAGLVINKIFQVDLLNLIVGGFALVAIGVVAVWSILSHMTATALLILFRPFSIHDWINFPGEEVGGRVIDLNLFYTLLNNDEAGEHFIVPNNLFFQKTFRHIPGKGSEKIELHEQLERKKPARPSP